ncbi:MAG: efflux RND transporter periplasmic adaptor subunit [Kofleriaceae bacterium]
MLLVAVGCGAHKHDHDTSADQPEVEFTRWTARHEFFVEHPVLIAGRSAELATHITKLDGHTAVASGTVTATIQAASGAKVEASVATPGRPGVFTPVLVPTQAGPCKLTIRIATGAQTDETTIDCVVLAPGAAPPARSEPPAGRITFVKESAWSTSFATSPASQHDLVPTLRTSGEIRATAGREARLTATAHGRVLIDSPVPVLGAKVSQGQVLARIVPQVENTGDRVSLVAELRQARVEQAAADSQLARSERLWSERTIPEKQLEEARTRVALARARLDAAQGKLAQFDTSASGRGDGRATFQVRSSVAGTLVAIHVSSGQTVEDGELLFTVVDLDRVWLHADVFEPDISSVEAATRATFRVDGYDQPITIEPPDGRVVTIGQLVDEKTRTVPIIFELTNPDQRLRIGSFATVWIETGAPSRVLAIPETAIVDDAGRKVAYVQVEAESFERRVLALGTRSGGWVEVIAGISPGDRVVTTGAYEIKLAAAGGAVPEHGHAH